MYSIIHAGSRTIADMAMGCNDGAVGVRVELAVWYFEGEVALKG